MYVTVRGIIIDDKIRRKERQDGLDDKNNKSNRDEGLELKFIAALVTKTRKIQEEEDLKVIEMNTVNGTNKVVCK